MPSFQDLGLRPELVRALDEADLDEPTAIQEAVIPALRRGGNLVARASSGSGKTLAYGLGVLDRLATREPRPAESEIPLRLLVLVPTIDEAERTALELSPYAHSVGLNVTVPGGSWGIPLSQAEIVISPPAEVMAAVRGATLKFAALEAIVIDGAAALATMDEWETVDALLDLVPRESQRVLVSAAFPPQIEDLVDRRVKRALRYPAEPALADSRQVSLEGRIGYVLVPTSHKLDALARQLSQPADSRGAPPVIFCRDEDRAADLAEQLSIRGFVLGPPNDHEADVTIAASGTTRAELLEEVGDSLGQTISYDVPTDARVLAARHGGDEDAVILATTRELSHVREAARLARLHAVAIPLPTDRTAADRRLTEFRGEIRRAVREEDLDAQMLLLEPLFEEFAAQEIAAALAALLRRKTPVAKAEPEPAVSPAVRAPEAGSAPATWARLYVGVGSRDDVRPGDLVGALAGEANISGSAIGRIEIRDSFSVVDVQAAFADQIIQAVNGTTIKGRSVRVDYDRAGARQGQARRLSRRPRK